MGKIQSIYLHIPFCHAICPFCAFAIHGNQIRLHEPFLDALTSEIGLQQDLVGELLQSVYIGGGTPSTLSLEEVERLLSSLTSIFPLAADCEVAFELNPEDTTEDYLAGLHQLGVNRVSLGLQSFDDSTLCLLGRRHTAKQGMDAVHILASSPIANFNLDFMFGIPGDEEHRLQADLAQAVDFSPAHLSLYGLDLEPGTLFGRNPAMQERVPARLEHTAREYESAVDVLKRQGYRHYETSNFCRPGFEGRQNLMVWDGAEYLGIGPGAHSFLSSVRSSNHRHLRAYMDSLSVGKLPMAGSETPTRVQSANEWLMLALRRDKGLELEQWEQVSGQAWDDRQQRIADQMVAHGLATLVAGRLVLTARGMMLGDEITAQLMM